MSKTQTEKSIGSVFLILMTIAFVSLVVGSILNSDSFTTIDSSATVINETGGCINSTGCFVSNYQVEGFKNVAITQIINISDNVTILAGNYTISAAGLVTNLTAAEYTSILTSYTYDYSTNNTAVGVNPNALSAIFSAFVVAITALITVGGTIIGVLWLLPYIKPLFDRKNGLDIAA